MRGLIQSIRTFFINHDFLEVETPLRIPAPAPEEHIEALAFGRLVFANLAGTVHEKAARRGLSPNFSNLQMLSRRRKRQMASAGIYHAGMVCRRI